MGSTSRWKLKLNITKWKGGYAKMIKVRLLQNNHVNVKGTRVSVWKEYEKHKMLFLMLIPGLLYYLVFHYLPMYGLIISFKDYRLFDGIINSPWAGFKYFKMAFSSKDFANVFTNTLIISSMKLLITFPAPIIFAILLNEIKNITFKRTVQTLTYLPHFLSWVVLGGIVINFLSPSTGPVNMLLKQFGMHPIHFVGSKEWFRAVLVGSSLWKELGWSSIVYLAALAGISPELYEAATIDGANRFKQIIHVTLPSIAPVVTIMLIFAVGKIVNDDFDQVFNLYNPAVYSVGDVLSTYVYRVGLSNMQFSYSAAIEFFKNSISFALVLGTNAIAKKLNDYGLW